MNLHGLLADDEAAGDLAVAEPFAQEAKDLCLPRRQRGEPAVPSPSTVGFLMVIFGGHHDHQEDRLRHRYGSISTVTRPLIDWA